MYNKNITVKIRSLQPSLILLLAFILLSTALPGARGFPINAITNCEQLDSVTQRMEKANSESFPIRFYERALSQALYLECHEVSIRLSQLISFNFHNKDQYHQAIRYLDTAINQSQLAKDTLNLLQSYLYKSYISNSHKKYEAAVQCLQVGLPLTENRDSSAHLQYQFHISLADNFMELGNYSKSIGHYQKALDLADQLDKPDYLARVFNNLGVFYRERKAFGNAREYFESSVDLLEAIPSSRLTLLSSLNLGNTFYGLGAYDQAELQLKKVCQQAEQTNAPYLKAYAEMFVGKVQIAQGKYLQARAFLLAAEKPLKKADEPEALSQWHQQMGHLEMQTNNLQQAEYHFQQAIAYLEPAKHSLEFDLIESYALSAQLYEKQGNTRKALEAYKNYHKYNDELYAKTNSVVLNHQDVLLQTNLENKKRSLLAENLQEQVNSKDRVVRLQSALAALLILFLVSAILAWLYFLQLSRSKSEINKKLQQLNDQILNQKIAIQQKNQILKKTNREFEQANDRLVHFVYSIAHDLRGPLNNIMGMLELFKSPVATKFTVEERQYLTYMQRSSKQMSNMIEELRTYAEIGKDLPPIKTIDTQQMVEDALQNMQMQLEQKEADITVHPLPPLQGHQTLIRQLFQNLISNAVKYQLSENTPIIQIGCQQNGDVPTFFVKDNGVGIPESKIDSIFEMFNRAHGSEYEGSGMGLALCKRIVHIHGGEIWVESQPEQGSTFFFTLPVNATRTATFAESTSAQLYPRFLV